MFIFAARFVEALASGHRAQLRERYLCGIDRGGAGQRAYLDMAARSAAQAWHCSRLRGVCRTSAMDGSDLKTTALPDDRIGCRRGERRVQVRSFQDVDTSNHLA